MLKDPQPHQRIFFAYDKSTCTDKDIEFLRSIVPYVGGVKLGNETISAVSPGNSIAVYYRLLQILRSIGLEAFGDWKVHDIGNTVARTVANVSLHGVCGITVDTTSVETIQSAVANRGDMAVFGVTVLTSQSDIKCKDITGRIPAGEMSARIQMLVDGRAQGATCSPLDLEMVRKIAGSGLLTLCPGIRDGKVQFEDDQVRTMTLTDALRTGADYVAIGRPIYLADNPVNAAMSFADEAHRAFANLSMV